MASSSTLSTSFARKVNSVKCPYQADQQVKFLHLQAEIESLLLEVQSLKQQRSIAGLRESDPISGRNSN
ncbi:hypothetical protein [Microcoleus sp. Pol1C5]